MFRRSKQEPATVSSAADVAAREGAKGRPTPTRREAEAAARVRARSGRDKNASKKMLRERRNQQKVKMREGLRSGDERFLPARDQGPVRRFVRDFVDSRLCMAEFLLPLLIVVMVSQSFAPGFANGLWSATILLVVLDTVLLIWRMKRELRRRFPDESLKGTTTYALLRSLQIRFLRLPKTRVKLGAKLSDRY
ncbi:MAG: DUF3043 domain-containing protein [Nocardioides sp.]